MAEGGARLLHDLERPPASEGLPGCGQHDLAPPDQDRRPLRALRRLRRGDADERVLQTRRRAPPRARVRGASRRRRRAATRPAPRPPAGGTGFSHLRPGAAIRAGARAASRRLPGGRRATAAALARAPPAPPARGRRPSGACRGRRSARSPPASRPRRFPRCAPHRSTGGAPRARHPARAAASGRSRLPGPRLTRPSYYARGQAPDSGRPQPERRGGPW